MKLSSIILPGSISVNIRFKFNEGGGKWEKSKPELATASELK